jgi:drug/metabolite transporter (DMT)-like permease
MFAWFILILLGAIWGASYMFIKVGVAEIPPFSFVEGRLLIATLALGTVIFLRGEAIPRTRRAWLPLMAMGIFNGVIPYTMITWGETHITSGLAAILTAAMPLFTILLAHFWTRNERMTLLRLIGVLIGFAGVVVVFLPELRHGLQVEFWGQFAIIVAAASYAIATLVARNYLNGVSHVMASTGQMASAALMMLPLALFFDAPWNLRPSLPAFVSLLTLALLGTSFAYVLYYWLIEHTGATRTSLVTYLIPVFGVFWGVMILSENVELASLIGLGLIIGGVLLVNRKA